MNKTVQVTYIANAGVLLNLGDKKILIDGFSHSKLPIYKKTPPEIKKQMIAGVPPFDSLGLLLFTHEHSDHFDALSTGEFLRHRKNVLMMANSQVIGEIIKLYPDLDKKRLVEFDGILGKGAGMMIDGVSIKMISLLHEGKEYQDVENIAYLVAGAGKRILHVGDAKPCRENFAHLQLVNPGIDLLIAPFPYVSLPAARQIIEKYIQPRQIAVVHLPDQEQDRFGWIAAAKKSYAHVKKDFIETVFLEKPGDYITI